MLGKDAGRTIGTIKLTSEHQVASTLESALAASDSCHDDDVEATFDHMQKKLRVTSGPVAKSESGEHSVRTPSVADSSYLPCDTCDLLDSIWGGSPVSSGSGKKLTRANTGEDSVEGTKDKKAKAPKGKGGGGAEEQSRPC